jgi:hypothetical protein
MDALARDAYDSWLLHVESKERDAASRGEPGAT